MIPLILAGCNYTSTYADGFAPVESDYQPQTLVSCNGRLYLLYHGGCPERKLYLWDITDAALFVAGDNHGSESSITCRGDTLYAGYYHFGDSAITVTASYDRGRTWNTVLVVDSNGFGEDEPSLLLLGDTLYLTFVYEISGPEIRIYRVPIGGTDTLKGTIPTPYVAHNSPIFLSPDNEMYILASSWNLESGGYALRYDGSLWHYGEVIPSGMLYDMDFIGDRIVVAGVSGPRNNRDVVVCTSDTSLLFSCTKLAEDVGKVTNVDLVAGTPTYVVWSDNSRGTFRLRMMYTEDLRSWNTFPIDDHLPSIGNTYYPVANLHNGALYIAYTTDASGRPSIGLIKVGTDGTVESLDTHKSLCGYYDKAGRKVRPRKGRVVLGCGTGYIKR